MIDKLSAARGELDVIIDLISFVEQQQQFLTVAHIPPPPTLATDITRATALSIARRRAQLHEVADRLRVGTKAARSHSAINDRFLRDVASLRSKWNVKRHSKRHQGQQFYIDIALPLPNDVLGRGGTKLAADGVLQRKEETQITVVPSATGEACIVVVDEVGGGGGGGVGAVPLMHSDTVVITGPGAISVQLHMKQVALAWKVLQRMVALYDDGADDGSQVPSPFLVTAVKHLISDGQETLAMDASSHVEKEEGGETEGGQLALDISAFCVLPDARPRFKAHALRLLATLCRSAHTPSLVVQVASQSKGGAQRSPRWLVRLLAEWVHYESLCHAISKSLMHQQHGALGVVVQERHESMLATTTKQWSVERRKTATETEILGIVVVDKSDLRTIQWRRPSGGQVLGRRELDTVLAPLLASI